MKQIYKSNKEKSQSKGLKACLLSLSTLLLLFMTGCKGEVTRRTMPLFTDQMLPAGARLTFSKESKIPPVVFNIDQRKRRIFNTDYITYGTKLDSAYLELPISTELQVSIKNVKTGISKKWSVTDRDKIDITGGKLLITITNDKEGASVTYDFRILTYGYNPNILTWKKLTEQTPITSKDGKIIEFKDKKYWVAVDDSDNRKLYQITFSSSTPQFTPISDATIPNDIEAKSIFVSASGEAWGLTNQGSLYMTEDLKTWKPIDLKGPEVTAIVSYDKEEGILKAIGREEKTSKTYYPYSIKKDGEMRRDKALPKGFPVRNAYAYIYEVEGGQHVNMLGGVTSEGVRTKTNYFTSDGLHWGEVPNTTATIDLPTDGGLYLNPNNGRDLYLVGGRYGKEQTPMATIKVSTNRGISWREFSKEQTPGTEFAPRYGASGIVSLEDGLPSFLILGGIVNGNASNEIWSGSLDTSGGIINSFED